MRVFAFIVVLLMLPLASAISDLSIYSEAEFSSQDEAPILVEWFHGVDDESQVEDLRKLDRDGEITLLHWRTGADNEGGNLPSDDADARHMYHSFLTTPAVAIDGYPENISDVEPEIRQKGACEMHIRAQTTDLSPNGPSNEDPMETHKSVLGTNNYCLSIQECVFCGSSSQPAFWTSL